MPVRLGRDSNRTRIVSRRALHVGSRARVLLAFVMPDPIAGRFFNAILLPYVSTKLQVERVLLTAVNNYLDDEHPAYNVDRCRPYAKKRRRPDENPH